MKAWHSIALGVTMVMVVSLCGCGGAEPSERRTATGQFGGDERQEKSPNVVTPEATRLMSKSRQDDASGIPNPAEAHCVEAGHRLEYVYENGIPVDGLCINDNTGAKCASWAYFRGECRLDSKALTMDRDF